MAGSDVTGSDVIFPRFFPSIVVVKMSHCCMSFHLRLLIILLVSSSFSCKGTFCTNTIVRKKRGENDVTSGHVTDVTSGHVTSGSTPFPNYDGLQVLKTVIY